VDEELINAPLTLALERLKGRDVFVHVLAPPHPAIGKGTLHVVRVQEQGERLELTVTYDDYDRAPGQPAKPSGNA